MMKWMMFACLLGISAANASEPLVSDRALELIIKYEVGGEAVYEKNYARPICPLCDSTASGVTIGIGYDLGHVTRNQFLEDWVDHPQKETLVPAIGLRRAEAARMAQSLRDVYTSYGMATQVFTATTVVRYYRIAARAFGPAFLSAPEDVRGALVSLVYNRGGAMGSSNLFELDVPPMKRDTRWEMRVIRDVCLPRRDWNCVAHYIRSMKRLWPYNGMRGLHLRRDAEAHLAESAID